jgi:lipid-A-disaccharide synthase
MKPKSFLLIAGETSGDILAAELVQALRQEAGRRIIPSTWDYQPLENSLEPRFFGAGGPQMAAAGVDLTFDLTAHSVTGFSEVLRNYRKFRGFFSRLLQLAREREPDAIICVDFSGFNRRFAHAIKEQVRRKRDWFHDWDPKIIQYVSPQVWASREDRVYQIARDFDLVLSIFPFEREWYAARVPQLPVEFVGHPIVDRYRQMEKTERRSSAGSGVQSVLLLPGSRPGELARHLPVLLQTLEKIRAGSGKIRVQMVLPNETLVSQAKEIGLPSDLQIRNGGLPDALLQADIAIASTGTVTLECAYFGVPTVALYKTSWLTWEIAKRIVTVKYGAMPNLLANREIFPEFIQGAATADNIARAAIELLKDEARRQTIRAQLAEVIASLGPLGASVRAARAVLSMLGG